MTAPDNVHVAILAGGSGTRFWPASRAARPKQMLPLAGVKPLLRETYERLTGWVPDERIGVITAARHVNAVRELLPELSEGSVIGEPRARNTAAACALACHWAASLDPDAVVVILPADHVIRPTDELQSVLDAAARRANAAGTLLTLGLRPRFAATGYGWIRTGVATDEALGHTVHDVVRFEEKPVRERAEQFLADGGYLWNLGMFAWRADAFLAELTTHQPGVAGPLEGYATAARSGDAESMSAALAEAFDRCTSISVDHGVLEHSDRVECVPCEFDWDDVGSFAALRRHTAPDADENVALGPLVALETRGCTTWTQDDGLVALLGVADLVVVHTPDVTLVAPRGREEEVKRLVAELSGDLEHHA